MAEIVHVIDEARSPEDAVVWTMWCGASCVALDDGTLIPSLDFYGEDASGKANCPGCREHLGLPLVDRRARVPA